MLLQILQTRRLGNWLGVPGNGVRAGIGLGSEGGCCWLDLCTRAVLWVTRAIQTLVVTS